MSSESDYGESLAAATARMSFEERNIGNVGNRESNEDFRIGRIKIAEPQVYEGERNHFALRNWILSVERYLELNGITGELSKTRYATMYLRGKAQTWYYSLISFSREGDIEWSLFVELIRRQFQNPVESGNIKDKFYSIRQKGSVMDYIIEYMDILSYLPPNYISEEASVEHFIRNLKTRTQDEVRMRKPKTLFEAYEIADVYDKSLNYNTLKRFERRVQPTYVSAQSKYPPPIFQKQTSNDNDRPVPMDLSSVEVSKLDKLLNRCFYCHKKGHSKKNCMHLKGQHQ